MPAIVVDGGPVRRWLLASGVSCCLAMNLACSGSWLYDQSQWEGTRTHDVNGAPLPTLFQAVPLPPPGVNVGTVTPNTLTTYHQKQTANEMLDLYASHLAAEGWVEEAPVAMGFGRRFVKGEEELQLDPVAMAAAGYGGYGGMYGGGYGPYGGMMTPSQLTTTHHFRKLVAPWDGLGIALEGATIRCSSTYLEFSYAGFQAPSGGEQLNELLRAFVLAGWEVESASPGDAYGSAAVTRGGSRVDISLGSPGPGGVTLWYYGP